MPRATLRRVQGPYLTCRLSHWCLLLAHYSYPDAETVLGRLAYRLLFPWGRLRKQWAVSSAIFLAEFTWTTYFDEVNDRRLPTDAVASPTLVERHAPASLLPPASATAGYPSPPQARCHQPNLGANFRERRHGEVRRIHLLETVWKDPIGLDLEYSE